MLNRVNRKRIIKDIISLLNALFIAVIVGGVVAFVLYVKAIYFEPASFWLAGKPEWITKQPFKPGQIVTLVWNDSVKLRSSDCTTLVYRSIEGCGSFPLGYYNSEHEEVKQYPKMIVVFSLPKDLPTNKECFYHSERINYCGLLGKVFPIIEVWPDAPFKTTGLGEYD